MVVALERLQRNIDRDKVAIPTFPEEEYKFEGSGLTKSYVNRLEFFPIVYKYETELKGLHEYGWLASLALSDSHIPKHVDKLVGTESAVSWRTLWDYLSFPLLKQLNKTKDPFKLDPYLFEGNFSDLMRFFSSDTITMLHIAPLHNFDATFGELELQQGLRIRRLTNDELAGLAQAGGESGFFASHELLGLKHAVELTFEARKKIGELSKDDLHETIESEERLWKLISIMRLYKTGNVAVEFVRTIPKTNVPGLSQRFRSYGTHKRFRGKRYLIVDDERQEFKQFWLSLRDRDIQTSSPLNVALRRFGFAYERDRLEDKLVDYMIAFEALFMKQEERSELVHRLSLRVAKLLGRDFQERREIQNSIKEFYRKRSLVVHGEETGLTEEFVHGVEDCLRSSVRILLSRLETQSQVDLLSRLDLD